VWEINKANMLKRYQILYRTEQQKRDARKMSFEDHPAIIFLSRADKNKYIA